MNINNIGTIYFIDGIAIDETNNTIIPLPYTHDSNVIYQIGLMATTSNNGQISLVSRQNDNSIYNKSYVTIRYTKTN